MASSWGHIVKTLERRSAFPLWLLSFLISLLPIYLIPQAKVSALWIAPVGLFCLFIIWILFRAVTDALELAEADKLPRVVRVHREGTEGAILLLTASRLFGQGINVTIYFELESGFEVRIGHGVVRNIQDNGLIQVEVRKWEEAQSAMSERILGNEQEAFARTSVKPAVDDGGSRRQSEWETAVLRNVFQALARAPTNPEVE